METSVETEPESYADARRWDAAALAGLASTKAVLRDSSLKALAEEVLTIELDDRATRAVALEAGLSDGIDHCRRFAALGQHVDVLSDHTPCDALFALFADYFEPRETCREPEP